ncbi:MAG TPA: cupin domain-containing protein [Opitutaceae bacterium]|jgi:uncharacterized cupin superfamily protein|nr:cupin domain-containing protein [Opitutaceae bacterium]
MKKINSNTMAEEVWTSPKGKFSITSKNVSHALGREPASTDFMKRHPFDVEITRVPAGKISYPYHSHSAQWEFYHVISGKGFARHSKGETPIEAGDAFMFEPGAAHTLRADDSADLIFMVVADNPIGESCYYPDSKKWQVRSPERALIRSEPLGYLDGEE